MPGSGKKGYLLIGVYDDGKISGMKVDDALMKRISGIRSDGNILPLPVMTTEKVQTDEERTFFRITIPCHEAAGNIIQINRKDGKPMVNGRFSPKSEEYMGHRKTKNSKRASHDDLHAFLVDIGKHL